MVATRSDQRDIIFAAVRAMYSDVAEHPAHEFHFPTGRSACALVGYPESRVALLPDSVVESFAGVGDPFAANVIDAGDVVLDIGSGSGTDVWIARQLVGDAGLVLGMDITQAMLDKLARNVATAGLSRVRPIRGNAEAIPLPDASVDVVTTNGVLNLIPDKRAAVAEIFRVLRPGGRLQLADIALGSAMSEECRSDPQLWAECVVGATVESEYMELFRAAGFAILETLGHMDYFAASPSAPTRSVAKTVDARALVLRAAKPPCGTLRPARAWPPREVARSPTADRAAAPEVDDVLEAYGQTCGTLEPVLKIRMRALASGQVLEVRSDEPAARLGVPAWARLAGHGLVALVEEDERRTRFYLRRR